MAPLRPLFAALVCSCSSGRGDDADVAAGPIYSEELRLCAEPLPDRDAMHARFPDLGMTVDAEWAAIDGERVWYAPDFDLGVTPDAVVYHAGRWALGEPGCPDVL